MRQDYNTIAEDWNISRFAPSPIKKKLLKAIKPKMSVLDVGCGNGFIAPSIIDKGAKYFGIDISPKLISIAKKKFKKTNIQNAVNFKIGSAMKLPYINNSFDIVLSFAVLHHIPSAELRKKYFEEIKRVLKPGGRASIIVWNLLNDWPRERFKIEERLKNQEPNLDAGDVFIPWKATKGKIIDRYLHIFNKKELLDIIKPLKFSKINIDNFTRKGIKEKNGEELVIRLKK